MSDDVSVTFLEDGKQPAATVAQALAAFLGDARQTLDIAIYDAGLDADVAATVGDAIKQCASSGVAVRIAYYAGPHEAVTVPPPKGTSRAFLDPLQVPIRPVHGYQALMHHKYVVRDAGDDSAEVWTGSTNWTSDAWSREENVILRIPSPEVASFYAADFEELWSSGDVENSGKRDGGSVSLSFNGVPMPATVWFSPGQGRAMAHAVADSISAAKERIVITSPVVTVGSILGALQDVIAAGRVPVTGIVDETQMESVRRQWQEDTNASWKIDAYDSLMRHAGMAGKRSTPYAPGSVHDYMHAKMITIDDSVYVGSYNFSHSGEENAENLLRFDNAAFADLCVSFSERLIARYGPTR